MDRVRQMKVFRPLKILNAIRAEDKDNLSTISTINTAKATIKRTEWNGRLIMQQSEWLLETLNYAMQTKVGPDEKVTHNIFLAHPRMVDLAQCFYQVLLIDCTYKTNKYNMPMLNVVSHTSDKNSFTVAWCFMEKEEIEDYIWALEQVRLIYRGINGNPKTPRDSQGRPHCVAYTLYKEYTDNLPYVILDHLIPTDDVDGDGNCGYHVAAEQLGHFEQADELNLTQIEYARTKMADKLVEDKQLYLTVIMQGDSKEKELKFKDLVSNVKWRKGSKKAGFKFRMQMPFGGQLLADTFTCVVILFSKGFPGGSFMYVPSRTRCDTAIKKRRIVMAHVNNNHYIGLKISEKCPLPRVAYGDWGDYTKEWTNQYEYGMNMWNALEGTPSTMPEHVDMCD
ncbi:uncharacterized protein LOC113318492 [Papaver somniferum]|uniref:uncharacterized protein LOC113318492 n=1 Tax=Papaver somniferum TaxID=3469 RepID=UPI000E6FDFF0|nr:uncharacterized protein LOC113318492 [Papaver somniferum]